MPRNRRKQNNHLDFEIHEDPPSGRSSLQHEGSDIRDFAAELSRRYQDEDDHERFVNDMTDSNMTKASTLVNGTDDEQDKEQDKDATMGSIVEDLEAEKERILLEGDEEEEEEDHKDAVEDTETHEEEDILQAVDEPESRRESAISESALEESESRRESAMSGVSYRSGTESRRESALSEASHRSGTESRRESAISESALEESESRRESAFSEASHRSGTESRRESAISESAMEETESRRESAVSEISHRPGTEPRRESALSQATYESGQESRRESGLSNISGTHESDSRRESTISAKTDGSRRFSRELEQEEPHDTVGDASALEEDDTEATASRRESAVSNVTHDQHTDASESRRQSAYSAISADLRSQISSRRESNMSHNHDRRTSGRTEALIQQAAKEIIAEINRNQGLSAVAESVADGQSNRSSKKTSARPSDVQAEDDVRSRAGSARPSEVHEPEPGPEHKIDSENAYAEEESDATPVPASVVDEAGDSSSQNEHEDDVFSDHSPRSSVGSMSEAEQRKLESSVTHRTRSPRISDFSRLEDDQEEEDFIPRVRETPRPPFRSPSQVKALQMSSPPPSVVGSPRSSKRTPLPTVSRLGSPMSHMQYSPKKTPPRFKRNTPPLVLLHATLLPLQWPWGHILESAHPDDLSEDGKNLRDTWRQLHDRLGDTVCERGILLPHPQNDFEILEERLLEALELPLKRRARILECGHYLGPSNEMTLTEEDSEDEYAEEKPTRYSAFGKQSHWCATCQSEIRFDALGPGKVFRVKVYASNGLMKAGAWDACWKEMERVDVELEPIVEPAVHDEIVRLAAQQDKAMELQQPLPEDFVEDTRGPEMADEPDASYLEQESSVIHNIPSSPPPDTRTIASRLPTPAPTPSHSITVEEEERRRRDEERLREIYGHTPPVHSETPSAAPAPSEYTQRETPASPSAEAHARREDRRQNPKADSLPDLLLEAFKVMMQDTKNVMIAVMSVLVLLLALRSGVSSHPPRDPAAFQTVVKGPEAATITVTEVAPQVTAASVASSIAAESSVAPVSSSESEERDTVVSEKIVRVVETVTETQMSMSVETSTVTYTARETELPVEVQDTNGDVPEVFEEVSEYEEVPNILEEVFEAEEVPNILEEASDVEDVLNILEEVSEAEDVPDILKVTEEHVDMQEEEEEGHQQVEEVEEDL